jgi:diamine N-acetyltransferase
MVEKMILKGEKIVLQPMTAEKIPIFYKWATQSDSTPFWYGELYGDSIPTYEEFTRDWKLHFFDGSQPENGRCFIISAESRAIGQINYNRINRNNNSVELDIIIADDRYKGRGYGSDALNTLVEYLFKSMNIRLCYIEVITKNTRAIKAYEKAGFKITITFVKNQVKWYRMERNG